MDAHIAKYEKLVPGKEPTVIQQKNSSRASKIEKFEVDDSQVKTSEAQANLHVYNERKSNNNENIHYNDEDYFTKAKRLYNDFWSNHEVRAIFCPFDDDSQGCQICYKVCVGMTVFLILWIIYLIKQYN
jgi:hypothetical protein